MAVLLVVGGWSLDRVAWARSDDFTTESGCADSSLVLRGVELRSRSVIDLLDARCVISEGRSADVSISTTEADLRALVSKLRAEVPDAWSVESVCEFGTEATERRTVGAISELGSMDTKAGLRSENAKMRLGGTESELDSGASVLERTIVGDARALLARSLGCTVGTAVMSG